MNDLQATKRDPIPTREETKGNQARHFVESISAHVLTQLGELRDQIDDLCRQIRAKQDELTADIDEHIQFAATSIKAKLAIADGIEAVAKHFPPKPAPTITQRSNGQDRHQ